MEFRIDESRFNTGDVLQAADGNSDSQKILGAISILASMAWDNDAYCDKEEAKQKLLELPLMELVKLVDKFTESLKEYALIKSLFENKGK